MPKHVPWWEKPVRVLQFNIEDRYGRIVPEINGKELVDLAEKLHANVLVIFARDAWGRTFYRGAGTGPEHPKMKGDIVREAVEEGKKRGIKVVVMIGHTANKYLFHNHSEWAQINVHGEQILLEHVPCQANRYEPEWPQLCINSPFIEYVKKEIEEVHRLDVDGVFLDSFRYQPDIERACYCQWCRKRFREEHGYDMPTEPRWGDSRWRTLWEWRYKVVVERLKELYELSKKIDPDKVFMYNSHPGGWAGRTNRVVELARDYIDAVFAECSEVDHQPPGFITEMTKLTRAMSGGKPVWSSRNYFHLYRTISSTTPLAIRQGLREAILGGGSPWLLIFSISYKQDPKALEAAEQVFKEHEKIEEYLYKAKPLYYVGILVSNHTRDYYGKEHPEKYIDGIRGDYYALVHNHLPVEFIAERDAENSDYLARFKVLIVENTVCMKDSIASAIEKYVERGGGLVTTYLSGTRDEFCVRRYDFAYKEVIGGSMIGVLRSPWTYIVVDDKKHPILEGIDKLIPWGDMSYEFKVSRATPNMGWHAMLDYVEGEVLAHVGLPACNWGHEYALGRSPPPLATVTKLPAIIVNKYGEGMSVYLSGQLGRHYWRTGLPVYRRLLVNAVKYMAGEPEVKIEAPETVHSEIFRQEDRIIIHLLNHTYNQRVMAMGIGRIKQPLPPYSSVEAIHPAREVIKIGGIRIRARVDTNIRYRVYLPIEEKPLPYSVVDNELVMELPQLNEYSVVVIEPLR